MVEEKTTANLRIALGHKIALELLQECQDTEELWLCVLLTLGIVNEALNKMHKGDCSIQDVLDILDHYDTEAPDVAATAYKLANEAICTVN